MANQFVSVQEPSSPTKKMQTFENTIASNVVEAEAITLVDSTGVEKATATNPARVDPTGTTTQPVSGTVAVSNFPATQPVSFTTPYDVKIQNPSGVEVDPAKWADVSATGTLTATGNTVAVALTGRLGCAFLLTGTWSATLVAETSVDGGTTWTIVPVILASGGAAPVASFTTNAAYAFINTVGATNARVRDLAHTSGTVNVTIAATTSMPNMLTFVMSRDTNASLSPPFFLGGGGFDSTPTGHANVMLNTAPVGTEYGQVTRPLIAQWLGSSAPTVGQKAMASSLPVAFASDQSILPISISDPTLATYSANYRLVDSTAGQLSLTFTFVANTDKQLATIYHAATATKTVRIRKITIVISTGALGVFGFEVRRLSATTAPATGNPAITPLAHDPGDATAEGTTLALPTTAGSQFSADSTVKHVEWNSAAASAVANPSGLSGEEIVLFEADDAKNIKPLVMRASNAEGYAVVGRCTTAVALRYVLYVEFTEQ